MAGRRLPLTNPQIEQLLQTLAGTGFDARRVEVTPDGRLVFHADPEPAAQRERDLLLEWEAGRGSGSH